MTKIFLIVLSGYLIKRYKILTPDLENGLGELLVKVLLPFLILSSANLPKTPGIVQNLKLSALIMVLIYISSILIAVFLAKLLRMDEGRQRVFIPVAVFSNSGFFGYPILGSLYGTEGYLYTMIYTLGLQLFMFSFGEIVMSGKKERILRNLFTNPCALAAFGGILLFSSPLRIPSPFSDALTMIGSMVIPISLILVGAKLADSKIAALALDKDVWVAVFLRNLFFPALVWICLKPFGLSPILTASMVIITALPTAAVIPVLATRHGLDAEYAARATALGTLVLTGTLPLWILLTANG